jgi:hypothetical protein
MNRSLPVLIIIDSEPAILASDILRFKEISDKKFFLNIR